MPNDLPDLSPIDRERIAALEAEVERLRGLLRRVVVASDLWLPNQEPDAEHRGEVMALGALLTDLRAAMVEGASA